MSRGFFITLEGLDGCGKSTQAGLLGEWLRARGLEVVHTCEPGGTRLGERIRELLLHGAELSPQVELLLYLADRAAHVEEVVRPALEAGRVVVCERFAHSSLAYQGFGRGLPLEAVARLNSFATAGLRPDLTLVLAVSAPVASRRKKQAAQAPSESSAPTQGLPLDRLERQDAAFRERVLAGYMALVQAEPERVRVIPGEGEPEQVHCEITTVVCSALAARGIMEVG